MSPKAVLVASVWKLAKLLQKELADHGIIFSISKIARDLGVTSTAAASRPSNLVHKRNIKAKHRIKKIAKIARISRKARKLFSGSAFSAATWGHQASGFSDSRISALESDALACTGINPSGRCRTIALAISYGILGTPRARIIRETVQAWIQLIKKASPDFILDVRVAWSRATNFLHSHPSPITQVRGILSNMIYIILSCKWDPISFNVWKDEDGDIWALTGGTVSPNVVASALIKSHFRLNLRRASSHYNGLGMYDGIDYHATMAVIRSLSSNHYPYKCAIESILSASTWPNQRVHDCVPHVSPICTRRGSAPDDALHCFWQCPANGIIEDEDVQTTQVLIPAAESGVLTHPCLWLRGILPSKFTNINPSAFPSNVSSIQIIKDTSSQATWASGTYYGDASGGEFSSFASIRRVGCGLAAIDSAGNLVFGAKSNLPGSVQTVPRGEIYALFMLVDLAIHLTELDFVTDNKGLFDAFNKGPIFCATTSSCDLYASIFQVVYDKAIQLSVRWMPSHLLEKPEKGVFSGMSNLDILGNDHADKLAVSAAKQACVTLDVSAPILYYSYLVKRIQNRLATILINLPNRPKREYEQKPNKPGFPFLDALKSSTHVLYEQDGRFSCARCLCNCKFKDPALKHWLSSQCVAIGSNKDRPIRLLHSHVHVGNLSVHHSHKLYIYCGLIYCNKCGARSGRLGLKLLSHQCGPPTEYGQQSLDALRQCKKPPNLDRWPSDPELGDDVTTPNSKLSHQSRGRNRKGAFFPSSVKGPNLTLFPLH